jgi:hypothetical protein
MAAGYGKDPFGTGPYGSMGGVIAPPPNPPNGGYGGALYGFGPYGSLGGYGAPSVPITGGYGGCAYGYGPYGCISGSLNPPEVIAAVSVTGFIIEVFFSNEMSPDADLFDPASYTITDLIGAAPVTVLSVAEGVDGAFGPTSVLLTHTGTTLGGHYRVVVDGPRDIGGTLLAAYAPLNRAELLTKGEAPPFTITPLSGNELLYEFEQDMLDEAGFSPGILQLDAYGYETTYPVDLVPTAVDHPYLGDLKNVKVDVLGMTSALYSGVVSLATAIEYAGDVLPAAATGFIAQEIGNGSTTQGTGEVLLNTQLGFSYGWRFIDTSGKIQPNSSYRCDFTFDVSQATITPALFDTDFANFVINDGAIQVSITLKKMAGVDTIEVSSGAFLASGSIDWSTGSTTVSLVRNQKADTYAVVVNDEPFIAGLTAAFTGLSSIPNGCQIVIDPTGAYDVVDFPLQNLLFTATQTVFSAAWNFLHNQNAPFTGDDTLTNAFALTECGPLVKGWGDATPATKQDVSVYVNDVPVEVESVNPYIGKIFTTIPIPLMPPGTMDVAIDYIWFPCPIVEFAGLNTEGLVLNKFDCKPTCNNRVPGTGWSSGSLLPGGGKSSPSGARFGMGVVLGTRPIRKPLLRSPRFIAFQKAYTAAINSPTTLLLNRDPHRVALPPESEMPEGEVIFYDGTTDPTTTDPPWILNGVNSGNGGFNAFGGAVQVDETDPSLPAGVFPITDGNSGPYEDGNIAFYYRDYDASFDSTILLVSRFYIDVDAVDGGGNLLLQPDGVFTGVAFGAHDNNHLYVVGALLVNDIQHIGMLTDPAFPELLESWTLAYNSSIKVLTATTFQVSRTELPEFLQADLLCDISQQFQLFDEPQAGIYTAIGIEHRPDGTSIVTIDASNPFPNNPQIWGGAFFNAFWETEWDGGANATPVTYRLIIKHDIKGIPKGEAELFIGGVLRGRALRLEGAPPFAIPPDGVLVFPTGDEGEVFFGSISRRATSASLWSFSHYGVEPAQTTIYFRGIVAAAEMNSLPEDDPNNIWFLTQEFGSRIIDATGDQLLLKGTSGIDGMLVEETVFEITATDAIESTEIVQLTPDLTIGYARIEPFLTRRLAIDLDSTFQVDSGVLGAGDLEINIQDGTRMVKLATILYEETTTRQLLFMENVSLSGLLLPDTQLWTKTGDLTNAQVQGQRLQFTQAPGETVTYTTDLVASGVTPQGESRIIEARFRVQDFATTDPSGDTGIMFGADVGTPLSSRGVGVQLRAGTPNQVFLFSIATGTEVVAFDFDWTDGEIHTYRAICDVDTNTVTLVIDDVVQTPTDLTNFDLTGTETQSIIGLLNPLTDVFVEWEDYSTVVVPPSTAKRTLGVWLGGDVDDIDNWEIPRTDALDVPNSDLSAVIEEMDWRSRIRLRIHRDPAWGVTILRPDMPPPPYFTGDFGPQFTQPSAGWINVEYRHLPPVEDSTTLGYVKFGSFDNRSITQQRIDDVRYRIYKYASEDIIMPHHMVLNQYNVITSGEYTTDITVETAEIESKNNTIIKLSPTHIYANRVFSVQWVNFAGDTVTFFPGSFEFDESTQTITIVSHLILGLAPQSDLPTDPDPLVDWPNLADAFPAESFDPNDQFSSANINNVPSRFPVTVSFAPGKPLTNTYICSQPLLDGVTLLNAGTPSVTKSHVGKDMGSLAFGSRINDPNDTLNNDPDFILNDPFRRIEFTSDPEIDYENIEFCEVSEGEDCRLSPFCDDSIPGCGGTAPDGSGGDIGNGLMNVSLSGLAFTEVDPITFSDGPTGPFGNISSSDFLEASGGDAPPGGNLQNSIIFTPLGPNTPPSQGVDGTVGWGVFGQLYDTVTNTTQILYFGTETPQP